MATSDAGMEEGAPESARGPSEEEAAIERQRALAHQLREMFNDVVREPLPDQFQALIDELGDFDSGVDEDQT